MSELKPCPFCGESKLLYSGGCGFRYDDDDNQIRLFRVHCRTCKGRTGLFESLDEAVEAWNRRTNSTTIQPSALGTNLAEVGTDCISREQAIKATWQDTGYTDPFNVMTAIRDRIQQLPPIQPKRGRWIGKYPVTSVCSECGFLIHDSKVKVFAFCPNCGADMRGEQDDESRSNSNAQTDTRAGGMGATDKSSGI